MPLDDHPYATLLVVLLVAAAAVPASSTAGVQPADYSADASSDSEEATVVGVTDGDTIDVRYDNGTTETVRLLGVDTLEVHADNEPGEFEGVPDTEDGRTCLYYEGKVASAMAENRLLGERVTLKYDSDRPPGDLRSPARVRLRGRPTLQLPVGRSRSPSDLRLDVQQERRVLRRRGRRPERRCRYVGLPRSRKPTRWSHYRTISPRPAGDDYENVNDEFVVLQNRHSSTADLSDWRIRDEYGNDYDFPGGVSLDSGETVTLHTGTGSDSASHLYWGRTDYAVWNNDGDTGYLYDEHGDYVESKSY